MLLVRSAVAIGALAISLLFHATGAAAQGCTFAITGGSVTRATGGITRFFVTAQPATCAWAVVVQSGEATVDRTFAPAEGDGYFDVSFGPNMSPMLRTAWLGFVGDGGFSTTLAASQMPYTGCSYLVSAPGAALPNAGGTVPVLVSTWSDFLPWLPCPWMPGARAPWLTVPGGARFGNGGFDITVLPNPGRYSRTGTVGVSDDRSVTVTQFGTHPTRNVEIDGRLGADAVLYDSSTGRYDAFALGVGADSQSTRQHIDWYTWGTSKSVEPADFNRDGLTDFVVYDGVTGQCRIDLAVYSVVLPARALASWDCGTGPLGARPTILDADGDGLSDVFLYDSESGAWLLKLTRDVSGAGGMIYTDAAAGIWATGWQLRAARLDADNRDDLFLYNPSAVHVNGGRWFQVLSRDNGTFEYIEGGPGWAPGWTVVPGDFDGDGQSELFLYGGGGTGYWFIVDFRPEGTAYFGGQLWAQGWDVHAADFNGDNITDLFLYQNGAGPLQGMWFRVLSTGAYDFDYVQGDMRWAGGWRVSIADLDGDGLSDVFLDGRSDGVAAQVLTRGGGTSSQYAYDFTWPVADTILLPRRITP